MLCTLTSRTPMWLALTAAVALTLAATSGTRADETARSRIETGEEALRAALAETIELEFIDTPLEEAMTFLGDLHGIPIVIEEAALAEKGISLDEPITRVLSGITLRSALEIMLKPLELTYVIENQVLKITTESAARQKLAIRVYNVRAFAEAGIEPEELARMITETVDADPWVHADGLGGTASALPGLLVVSQTQRMHRRIGALLEKLKRRVAGKPAPKSATAEREARIRQVLSEPTEIEFIDTPLQEAMTFLADLHGIRIVLDEAALAEQGVSSDVPVNRVLNGVTLRNALEILLGPLDLAYLIEDEVLKITTRRVADSQLETRIYEVSRPAADGSASQDVGQLLLRTTGTLPRIDWVEIDGVGGTVVPVGGYLVVSQTQHTHHEIARLLREIQRYRNVRQEDDGPAKAKEPARSGPSDS